MNTNQNRRTITALIPEDLHGQIGEVSYQLRLSQTQLVSDALVHYFSHLRKTRRLKPLATTAKGLAFQR
jgi:hypothetical protein